MNPTSTINIPAAVVVLQLLPIGEPGAASHEVPSVRPTLIGRQSHCATFNSPTRAFHASTASSNADAASGS